MSVSPTMSVGTENPNDIVWAALKQPEEPTEHQVKTVCQLSYDEDSRKEIQKTIDQLLKSQSSDASHEVQNALSLMKNCLADASPEFVTFCIAELQFMSVVPNQEEVGNSANGGEVNFEAPAATIPVPLTPPASPITQKKTPTSHPNPDSSSPKSSTAPQMDAENVHDSFHSPSLGDTPGSVLLFPKDKVAGMTFTSGDDGLEAVLGAVDDLGKYSSPIKGHPEDLLKALECVHHCLFHGSAPFVGHCVQNVWIFSYLRRQSLLVQPTANAILNFLTEQTRPDESKRPPPPNSTHPSASSSPQHPSPASPKTTRTPAKIPLPTPKPTPPKLPTHLEYGNESSRNAGSPAPRWGIVPSASLFLLKREDVAMMSFQREDGKMAATLIAMDDLKRSESSIRRHPDKLAKALDCVLYCLIWGSAPFVARCREQKTIFNLLRQHSSLQVRNCANAIFDFVKGYLHLPDKVPLIRHAVIPSPSFSGSIREYPDNPLAFEVGLDISKCVTRTGMEPFAKGHHADIWGGIYRNSREEAVAIKILLRLRKMPGEALQQHLNRELPVWRSLFHRNISLFFGVVLESGTIGLVSPRYLRGNVLDFVKMNQTINPSTLLQGMADGVLYLHANGIVHGNIKCANVMVSDDGASKLIDTGVAQAIDVAAETGYTTSAVSSLRWSAPELLSGAPKSEKGDVYAFASTYIEIITLKDPYSGLSDAQVLRRVKSEGIPPRPTTIHKFSFTDSFWTFLTTCWKMLPQDRPNIVSMRRKLAEI